MWYAGLPCPVWLPWVQIPTSLPLTSRFLEAVAPLIVGKLAILEGVTGVEERFDTGLILIQVDGIDLWVVKQKVIIHIQLVKHPAQRVLADGQNAGVKSCRDKGTFQWPPSLDLPTPRRGTEPMSPTSSPETISFHGLVSKAHYKNIVLSEGFK